MSKKQNKEANKKQAKSTKNNLSQNHQQRLKKEKQALQIIYQENMFKYLKNLESHNPQNQKIEQYSLQSIEKISKNLQSGDIIIPESSISIPKKQQKPVKLTYEQQKQLQIKIKRENIQRKLQYINEQLKGQRQITKQKKIQSQPLVKEFYTKQQHQRKVQEIQQQKQQRKKRQEELKQQQQRKEKEEEQRKQIQRQQQEFMKQKKRAEIQQKIKKRKLQHEQLIQRSMSTVKDTNYLYEKMQKNFNTNIQMPLLEQKKNKLKQIRQFNKQYDIEAVKQHERNYEAQALQKSQMKKTQDPTWKYDAPSKVERLQIFLQQQQKQLKQKLQYRKNRIQEMKQAYQAFNSKLKMYKPQINQQKRRQIQNRIEEEKIKNENKNLEYDLRKIGLQYLQVAKKMKRSQTVRAKMPTVQKIQKIQSQKYLQSSRVARSQSFYEDARRRKIQQIINSQESNHEKYKLLKLQSQKLDSKIKQKDQLSKLGKGRSNSQEQAELLVSNIKAKFGLINLMKLPINTNKHDK